MFTKPHAREAEGLCRGWIFVYEVWTIYPFPRKVVRIEEGIPPSDLSVSMRHYTSQHTPSDGLRIPLAISPDATCFIVLHTVHAVETDYSYTASPRHLSQPLPLRTGPLRTRCTATPSLNNYPNSNKLWLYSIHFAPCGSYFLVWDQRSFVHYQYIYRIKMGQTLALAIAACGNVYYPGCGRHFAFHPDLALVAISVSNRTVSLWQWRKFNTEGDSAPIKVNEPSSMVTLLSSTLPLERISQVEKIRFSACGSYVILDRKLGPEVIPINKDALQDPWSKLDGEMMGQNVQNTRIYERVKELAVIHSPGSEFIMPNLPTIADDQSIVSKNGIGSVAVKSKKNDVILTTHTGDHQHHTAKLVTFPDNFRLETAKATLIRPAAPGDSVNLSIDREWQTGYPLFPIREKKTDVPPSIIQRDPRFISALIQVSAGGKEPTYPSGQESNKFWDENSDDT